MGLDQVVDLAPFLSCCRVLDVRVVGNNLLRGNSDGFEQLRPVDGIEQKIFYLKTKNNLPIGKARKRNFMEIPC